MKRQEFALTNKSLGNEINSNISKLMLTKHGYTDRQDVNVSGEQILDRTIKRLDGSIPEEQD